jgi:hypothetical protein
MAQGASQYNTNDLLQGSTVRKAIDLAKAILTSLAARMMVLICERSPHSAKNVSVKD